MLKSRSKNANHLALNNFECDIHILSYRPRTVINLKYGPKYLDEILSYDEDDVPKLNLRHMSVPEAVKWTNWFLGWYQGQTVRIVTGRGRNSPGGIPNSIKFPGSIGPM